MPFGINGFGKKILTISGFFRQLVEQAMSSFQVCYRENRMTGNFRLLMFLAFLAPEFLLCSRAIGQTHFTAEQLRKELPKALNKIGASYSNVRGTILRVDQTDYELIPEKAKAKQRQLPAEQQLHGIQLLERLEIKFAASGDYRKCETILLEMGASLRANKDAQAKSLYQRVDCIGPRGTFTLGWPTREASPELREFRLEGSSALSQYDAKVDSFLRAIYSLPFKNLADLMTDDQFQISRVDSTVVEGHDCARVEFRYQSHLSVEKTKNPQKNSTGRSLLGSFVTDPTLGWALRSWEYSTPGTDSSQATEITYHPDPSGLPVPAEIVAISNKARRNQITFPQFAFGTTPDQEFTLTQYGMPELDRPIGDVASSSIPYWIAGLAVVLLGAAAYFWHQARQRPSATFAGK